MLVCVPLDFQNIELIGTNKRDGVNKMSKKS